MQHSSKNRMEYRLLSRLTGRGSNVLMSGQVLQIPEK
jgi:hypothetical protein